MNSEKVLSIFKEITRIPRESGHEEPMTAFLQRFAGERHLECKTDKTNNVCIVKEASKGKENVPTLVLQGHQDMVCEKRSGVQHDFLKDPIEYVIEDGWMVAKDTTLGADDGIGVAAMLALLDSDLPMGKIECVFTISEETGMDGAFGMEPGFFTGRTLINLDSEDEGQMFIGCAGGLDTTAVFNYKQEDFKEGYKPVRLEIGGALGGHSGDDINKERMNALKQLVRFLYTELQYDFQLITLEGGNKHNAICREAYALIAVPADEVQDMLEDVKAFRDIIRAEFASSDPEVTAVAAEVEKPQEEAIEEGDAAAIIATLLAIPHGVQSMSMDIPGLVQTSTNMAAVHVSGNQLSVLCSHRSSVESELSAIAEKLEATCFLGGFDIEHKWGYPGWKPNLNSHILSVCVESYKKLFGVQPEVKAIHAGLECGMFLKKFPDLDMISFGPTLRGVHAPGEKLELASLDKFVQHLNDIVTNYK